MYAPALDIFYEKWDFVWNLFLCIYVSLHAKIIWIYNKYVLNVENENTMWYSDNELIENKLNRAKGDSIRNSALNWRFIAIDSRM